MAAKRSLSLAGFIVAGLAVALALAFFVSPRASSQPDGLEKVAGDKGFLEMADDHALADGPLADYTTRGIDNEGLSTGVAGIIGVTATFAIGTALFFGMRHLRGRDPAANPPTPARATPGP